MDGSLLIVGFVEPLELVSSFMSFTFLFIFISKGE